MYANDKSKDDTEGNVKESAAALLACVLKSSQNTNVMNLNELHRFSQKTSADMMKRVEMPQTNGPTYAGQQEIEEKSAPAPSGSILDAEKPENDVNPVLQKLSVVLSKPLAQMLENQKATAEARMPQNLPQNPGIRRYAVPTPYNPLPMGAQPSAGQQQPAQAPQTQPPTQAQPVGGGSNPMANPINAFGAISASGNINGNAAFGVKNSPDSSKSAEVEYAGNDPAELKWHDDMQKSIAAWEKKWGTKWEDYGRSKTKKKPAVGAKSAASKACSCGCGDTTTTCKCGSECSCRKAGGSCYKESEKQSGKQLGLWDRIRMKRQRGEKPASPGDKDYPDAKSWNKVTAESEKKAGTPAWQRSAGKNPEGGLNEKGRKSYERETGGDLKAPVTESNPSGERAKRQNSFCSRMCGMKRVNTGAGTAKDPDSRINKSLRKWNCKCSAYEFGQKMAAYKGINEFSGMPGPDQISHAVSQLGMLKALVRPDDSVLKQRGISRAGFQSGLKDIYQNSKGKEKYDLSAMAPKPGVHAALGGLGGLGAAGLLGYAGVRDPAVLAGTTAIPAIAAYFRATNKRQNLLNTAKIVKDYGLLRPKLLQQAYPLLAAD
jgi:hypothetical protein